MQHSQSLPKLNAVTIDDSTEENNHGGTSIRRSLRRSRMSGFNESSSIGSGNRCCGCPQPRLCWWEPDQEDINDTVDFTQETSLHGLKFICQPQRHLLERMFWLLAFILSALIAAWLISDIWINWINSPVVVTFQTQETTIDKIPFPAVTICNMNKVQRSKAMEYIKDAEGPDNKFKSIHARKNIYYMNHVCSASKSFSQKFNYSSSSGYIPPELLDKAKIRDGEDEQSDVARFLRVASQKCSDMLLLCLWEDEVFNCSKLFKPIETDFGKCCTFNMMPQTLLSRHLNDTREDPLEILEWSEWDYDSDGLLMTTPNSINKTFPRRQRRAGKSSGLSVLLNPDLEQYFCTSSDSQGFRLLKHLPLDIPSIVDFGIAIRPNAEIFMSVKPELTLAHSSIKDFKLDKRNCYFRGELQLAYFKHYTTSNCLAECLANQTFETCGCVRYYMPRDDTRELCGPLKFECAEDVRRKSYGNGIKSVCDICWPTCTELEYFSETTVTPIQRGVNLWKDERNKSARWSGKNVTIVHIYFQSDSTYAKLRKELYGLTDLIANTGGLLGLTLGFSGLSLMELIYFYTLRAWCRTRRKHTIWAIVAHKLHRVFIRARNRGERYDTSGVGIPIENRNVTTTNVTRRSIRYSSDDLDNVVTIQNKNNKDNSLFKQSNLNPLIDGENKWKKFSGFGTTFSGN